MLNSPRGAQMKAQSELAKRIPVNMKAAEQQKNGMLLDPWGQPNHVGLHRDQPILDQDFSMIVKLSSIYPIKE